LLDFYDILWDYEPRAFAVEWDDKGDATGFFRPDFYLPDEDLYIEITTMNQKLVTKKNRKVKLLRSLYPEIDCKIFYQRDYLNLLVKYELADVGDEDVAPAPTRMPGPPQVVNLGEDLAANSAVS
jgi:hypoxanthine phosphoribosyltransferase